MAAANSMLVALSDADRRQLEALLIDFDRKWHKQALADRVQELPPEGSALRRPALVELIKIDLEKQWQLGRRILLETYLKQYPELGGAGGVPADLLQAEYEVRKQFGAAAELSEYARRFPQQAATLAELLKRAGSSTVNSQASIHSRETPPSPPSKPSANQPTVPGADMPERFGRYHILRQLGQGGMGAVYLAMDTQLDRKVALKVPHFSPTDGPEVLERFYREARSAATFSHPNLCPVYDVGQIDGRNFLTMAYIEGKPLAEVIGNKKPVAERATAALVRKVALALEEAHKKGVVHRDLKPSNIMINQRREPVVMDFGLARRAKMEDARLTQSGVVLGTPAYMAPEQISGDPDAIGLSCDIYSLGVILYELLTGSLPFRGPTMMSVMAQALTDPPEPPSQRRPGLDPKMEAVCLKAMAKKPEDRYASMSELAAALAEFLRSGSPAAGDETERAEPVADKQTATALGSPLIELAGTIGRIPRRLKIFGAGAAAILLLGVVFYVVTDNGTARIELLNPTANVDVKVDGKTITIDPSGKPIKLRVGEHKLIASADGFEAEVQSFTIRRGKEEVLRVKLAPGPRPNEPAPTASDYQALATGRWLPILTKLDENIDYRRSAVSLKDGVIELTHGQAIDRSIQAKDMIIRAKVKKLGGQNVSLAVRDSADGCYGAWYNGNDWFGFHRKKDGIWEDLNKEAGRGGVNETEFFEFALAVVGDRVTVYANGKRILDVRDGAVAGPGSPGVRANKGKLPILGAAGGLFKDVEVQVLDQESVTVPKPSGLNEQKTAAPDLSKAKLLHSDNFDNPKSGFPTHRWVADMSWDMQYKNGRYSIRRTKPGWTVAESPWTLEACACQAQGRIIGDADNFWGIELNNGQRKRGIGVYLNGRGELRLHPTYTGFVGRFAAPHRDDIRHSAIKTGEQFNTLLVIARGRQVEVYVNGVAVCEPLTVDFDYLPGRFHLFMATKKIGEAEFERVSIWSPAGLPTLAERPAKAEPPPRPAPTAEPIQHANAALTVAFSPDGRLLASGGRDGTVRLWDATTRKLHATFVHGTGVGKLAVSAHGKVLSAWTGWKDAPRYQDWTVRFWDLDTLKEFSRLANTKEVVGPVAFDPKGKRLATASIDRTIRLFNLENGEELARWQPHTTEIHALAFSPDGTRLASGGGDFLVKVWDVASRKEVFALPVLEDKDRKAYFPVIHCLAFSPDGTSLFAGSIESNMWNAATGEVRWKKRTHTFGTFNASFSPDGKTLASAGSAGDGTHVLLADAATGAPLRILNGPNEGFKGAKDVAFDPLGRFLASAGPDNRIRLWDVKTWTELDQSPRVAAPSRPPEAGSDGAGLSFVKVRDFKGHTGQVHSVAFSGDGKHAITGSPDKSACVWHVETGERIVRLVGHGDAVTCVALSADGTQALTGSADKTVAVWEVASGRRVRGFAGHEGAVRSVAFDRTGKWAASAGQDHTIRLWALDGGLDKVLTGHADQVASIAFSPTEDRLLSGGWDNTVRLWDVKTGTQLKQFDGHTGWVQAVAFSADGKLAASGSGGAMKGNTYHESGDISVRIWDLATGKETHKITGDWGGIATVAFMPAGNRLLFSEWRPFRQDRFLFLWDIDRKQALARYQDPVDWSPIISVAVSPDGKNVLIGRGFKADNDGQLLGFTSKKLP